MAEQGVVDKVESDGDELPEAVLRELPVSYTHHRAHETS